MGHKIVSVKDVQERLSAAQWVLEQHLAWIAAAEVKVGVIVALNTALLGGLAAAFSSFDVASRTTSAYMCVIAAALLSIVALICAAMAVLPRTHGPKSSPLFFAPIASRSAAEFSAQFKQATDEQLLTDWSEQIHRNAQIACNKYAWVRKSMACSFLAIIPWIIAITLLAKN